MQQNMAQFIGKYLRPARRRFKIALRLAQSLPGNGAPPPAGKELAHARVRAHSVLRKYLLAAISIGGIRPKLRRFEAS